MLVVLEEWSKWRQSLSQIRMVYLRKYFTVQSTWEISALFKCGLNTGKSYYIIHFKQRFNVINQPIVLDKMKWVLWKNTNYVQTKYDHKFGNLNSFKMQVKLTCKWVVMFLFINVYLCVYVCVRGSHKFMMLLIIINQKEKWKEKHKFLCK